MADLRWSQKRPKCSRCTLVNFECSYASATRQANRLLTFIGLESQNSLVHQTNLSLDETSLVTAGYSSPNGRANRLDGMRRDIGLTVPFTFSPPICKTAAYPFLGGRGNIPENGMGSSLNNGERQDIRDQIGHLRLGPQSKSRYISPDFFAMRS